MALNTTSLLSKTALGFALTGAALFAHAESSFSCASGAAQDCALATSGLSWAWDGIHFKLINGGSGHDSEIYFDLSAGMAARLRHSAAFDSDASGTDHGLHLGESATFKIHGTTLGRFAARDDVFGAHVGSLIASSASVATVSAVPEPETYMLMLAGLGALGLIALRRTRA